MANTKQHNPYKHLVDVYSVSKTDPINPALLKECLELYAEEENKGREELLFDKYHYVYQIPKDKKFSRGFIFSAIQAGYNVDDQEMIKEVNA